MSDPRHVPVAIVGGGPAGLTAAILLAQHGVEATLFERRDSDPRLPKAHIVNQRTMEILREAGVADDVYALGSPLENMSRVAWYTSWRGPTELHGRELARSDSWGGGADLEAHLAASPARTTNLPQIRLEPILMEHAKRLLGDRLYAGHEVVGLEQDADRALLHVEDRAAGATSVVSADYVIGADGGRTIGEAVGARLEGERDLVEMVNAHISAPTAPFNPDPDVCIYWFVNPDKGGGIGSGVLVKMGGKGWGQDADQWVFSLATTPGDPTVFDEEYTVRRAREAIGVDNLEIEVRRISHWRLESVIADHYRFGRVFLAGDAAHRHPPTGGLGMNSAIGDVHNLCWKLAAVLGGQAGETLLDSYEPERRPVAQRNAEQSLASFFQHGEVDAAIGLAPDLEPAAGWAAIAGLFSDSPAGTEKRQAVARAAEEKKREFRAHNLEVGYTYAEGAMVPDGSGPPQPVEVCEYRPGTWPGHRIPHAWLRRGEERVSTIDLAARGRFTLFTGADGDAWAAALDRDEVDLVAVGPGRAFEDPDGRWEELREVGPDGAILVRPDQHVAWRSRNAGADPAGALRAALDRGLGRTPGA